MFADIWDWIVSIVTFIVVTPQLLLVIFMVGFSAFAVVYGIWKLILHVLEKVCGVTLKKADEYVEINGVKYLVDRKYWDKFNNPKPQSKWDRIKSWWEIQNRNIH